MAINRPVAFQFYPKDWLSDEKVRRLSYETKGIYIELLAIMWNEGNDSIHDDDDLPTVLGISPERWLNARSELQRKDKEIFIEKDQKLISKKLQKIRTVQTKFRKQRQKAGRMSGKARQAKSLQTQEESNKCSSSVDVSLERGRTLQSSSSSSSSSSTKDKKELMARFDRFWEVYPHKVAKLITKRVWNKIEPDEQLLETMLGAIKVAVVSADWMDGFAPNPATWLNGERWNDEPRKTKEQLRAEYLAEQDRQLDAIEAKQENQDAAMG